MIYNVKAYMPTPREILEYLIKHQREIEETGIRVSPSMLYDMANRDPRYTELASQIGIQNEKDRENLIVAGRMIVTAQVNRMAEAFPVRKNKSKKKRGKA